MQLSPSRKKHLKNSIFRQLRPPPPPAADLRTSVLWWSELWAESKSSSEWSRSCCHQHRRLWLSCPLCALALFFFFLNALRKSGRLPATVCRRIGRAISGVALWRELQGEPLNLKDAGRICGLKCSHFFFFDKTEMKLHLVYRKPDCRETHQSSSAIKERLLVPKRTRVLLFGLNQGFGEFSHLPNQKDHQWKPDLDQSEPKLSVWM